MFVYGYAKGDRGDLCEDELADFKKVARHVLSLAAGQMDALVARGDFEEVMVDERAIP